MSFVAKPILSQLSRDFTDRFRRKVLKKDPVRPWMKPREVEIVLELMRRKKPERILEWGAGYGTIFFSREYGEFEHWVSIEHNGEWAARIRDLNTDERVSILHVEANDPVFSDPWQEGGYENFKDYIEHPVQLDQFDLILVDGRARNECLKKSGDLLRENGILVLHDANRRRYRPLPENNADECLFEDYRTLEGGLWIATRNGRVDDLMDIRRHRQVWEVFRKYGKWLEINVEAIKRDRDL